MPKNLSSTAIRIVSALVALIILFSLYYFFRQSGLLLIVASAAFAAQVEFSELVIDRPGFSFSRVLLIVGCFFITLSSVFSEAPLSTSVGIVLVVFFSFFLIRNRNLDSLEDIRDTVGVSALGLLYVGILPSFVVFMIKQPLGDLWFFSLLIIVFSGDTLAYFVGRAAGVKKILPKISPNKTWMGAVGGLFGSLFGVTVVKFVFFTDISVLPLIWLGLLGGAAAQIGDFFESLLKRVANKKDSGALMPGHGGVLDRIDGVLFAAPFVYFASKYFSSLF